MRARVFVTLKSSVFDPQGKVIADALHSLGYGDVTDVRQGKYFELDLTTNEDAFHAAKDVFGQDAEYLWHKDTDLKGADVLILPGGFAHGDYLRTGAMARFSPIMASVRAFAERGGPVLGICNGFQILLEAGVLPGAMLRNR